MDNRLSLTGNIKKNSNVENTPSSNAKHHPFDIIYQAALVEDTKAIEKALLSVSIHVLDSTNRFTPASKLAADGHPIAALFLIKNFKAVYSPSQIAYSFARVGACDIVYRLLMNLRKKHSIEVDTTSDKIAEGFARGGKVLSAYKFLKLMQTTAPSRLNKIIHSMLVGFIESGHMDNAYNFVVMIYVQYRPEISDALNNMAKELYKRGNRLNRSKILDKIYAEHPTEIGNFVKIIAENKKKRHQRIGIGIVLKSITLTNDIYSRAELACELKAYIKRKYNIRDIYKNAIKYSIFMKEQQISYNQLMAWLQPEVQTLLTANFIGQSKEAIDNINDKNIRLRIASFLIGPISQVEWDDLFNKFYFYFANEKFRSRNPIEHQVLSSKGFFAHNPQCILGIMNYSHNVVSEIKSNKELSNKNSIAAFGGVNSNCSLSNFNVKETIEFLDIIFSKIDNIIPKRFSANDSDNDPEIDDGYKLSINMRLFDKIHDEIQKRKNHYNIF